LARPSELRVEMRIILVGLRRPANRMDSHTVPCPKASPFVDHLIVFAVSPVTR
jgi:hypothetical protein